MRERLAPRPRPGPYRVERLEGRALLSFVTAPTHPVGYSAQAVAMADFNNDGDLDVATSNGYSETVSVLLGNGDGTFQPGKESAGIWNGYALVAGDFDNDGAVDLAVSYATVSLLLGNGDGTFQAPVAIPAGGTSTALAAGDFNGDTDLDLVATNAGGLAGDGTVKVILGNGDGTFRPWTAYAAGRLPVAVAVADLDRDGLSDLAVLNLTSRPGGGDSSTVSVLRGNGDGSFGPRTEFAAGADGATTVPRSLATGEFNGDGATDLAVANGTGDDSVVSVLLGNGDGTLRAPVDYAVGGYVRSVTAGDWDADGDQDLFTANDTTNSVCVFRRSGDGTFDAAGIFIVGTQPAAVAAGDIDGDGDADLAVANYHSHYRSGTLSEVTVLVSTGGGAAPRSYAAGSHSMAVAVGDFNEDGSRDLAVANYHGGYVSVFLGNGDGSFRSARQVQIAVGGGLGNTSVVVGDYNDDGHQDLALGGARLDVLLGRGDGTFAPTTFYLIDPTDSGSLVAADFNGDGALDFALSLPVQSRVAVLVGNGDGTFGPVRRYVTDVEPGDLAVGDFNRDGAPDLVTPNYLYGTVSLLLGNGDGTFRPRRDFDSGNASTRVAAADLDGDGNLDLAVGNRLDRDGNQVGTVTVLLGDGDGSFQPPADNPARVPSLWDVAVADFDRDGTPDLAVSSQASATVMVLPGRGDGTFLGPVTCTAGFDPRGIAVADFNGDGSPDLAAANFTSNTVTVLLNDRNWPRVAVMGRRAFYNNSASDGDDRAANAADDDAVAGDKRALFPGQAASFANVTSFDRGINGVMVDVTNLPQGATLSATDFGFGTAVPPTSVTVRRGAGIAGSDRITLIWPDGAVKNTWLQVTVKANANTGLSSPDEFSFGNLVGETGDAAGPLRVNVADLARVRRRLFLSASPPIARRFDFNGDDRVDLLDLATVRSSLHRDLTATPSGQVAAPRASALFPDGRSRTRRNAYELLTNAERV